MLTVLADDIGEIIVDKDVEINDACVEEFHQKLKASFSPPFSLLINKKHEYSYTFGAQTKLMEIEGMHAFAVLHHRNASKISTDSLVQVANALSATQHLYKYFTERDAAVAWLREIQANLR